MLISLSIGLVNVDDISLVSKEFRDHHLFWRNGGDRDCSISESDYLTLVEVSQLQYQALVREANDEFRTQDSC